MRVVWKGISLLMEITEIQEELEERVLEIYSIAGMFCNQNDEKICMPLELVQLPKTEKFTTFQKLVR